MRAISGDILGSLRVKISDPLEKSIPRKTFEFFFGLKYTKMITPDGGTGDKG